MPRRMQQERKNRGWSIKYIAAQTGLTVEAIRLIETGKRNPSYPVLISLENLFQMNHRDLFSTTIPDNTRKNDGKKAES